MQNQNQVFEPVDVIINCTSSKGVKLQIIKFKWNEKVYKVTDMLQSWKIPAGENFFTHYVVICGEQDIMCELSLNHKDIKWELVRYDSLT